MGQTCLAARRWSAALTLLIAAATPGPLLGADKKTVTRQEAQTLPTWKLAQRLLGASGARYSEVERPGEPSGMFAGLQPELGSLRFSTKPRWSGIDGLCVVDTVFISLERPNRYEPPTRDSPVVVKEMSTGQAFRFVGPTTRGEELSDSEGAAQKRRCREAGPAFNPPDTEFRNRFFYGKNEYTYDLHAFHVYFAGWALETTRHALAAGNNVALTCAEDPSQREARLCADPRTLIGGFQLADISFVAIQHCKDAPSTFCAEITLDRDGSSRDERKIWTVRLATDATVLDPLPKSLGVRNISVEAWTEVYD